MVNEENAVNDGADERMLGTEDKDKLAAKRDEVVFMKSDQQNGDAKIDIGAVNARTFSGMSKEELMKYANDPFWIRLRWIFFIAFWLLWLAMLIGALLIIIGAPKCAAPEPLPWYKRGPLAKFASINAFDDNDVIEAERLQATGAIYELPAELTYTVKEPVVEEKIKQLIEKYKKVDTSVILDITPNYVNNESQIFKNALADASKRSAFIWVASHDLPSNWLSLKKGSAWHQILPGNYILSRFGDGLYDLEMNDTIVRMELKSTLEHLIKLGIKGIRLKYTNFYLLSNKIEDEQPLNDPNHIPRDSHTEYGFWSHTQTTLQEGLGDVLNDYRASVKNITADAFLSVTENIVRPEIYQTSKGDFGIDIPIYGDFMQHLDTLNNDELRMKLENIRNAVGNHTCLQWEFVAKEETNAEPSALLLFMSLLPGVPVMPMNSEIFNNISITKFKQIEQLRISPSYMHGDFEIFTSGELFAYTRIKSGNPGYFVTMNPTDLVQKGNFTHFELPDKMSVVAISDNFNITGVGVKSKVMMDSFEVSPHATIVLTYVPVKSG